MSSKRFRAGVAVLALVVVAALAAWGWAAFRDVPEVVQPLAFSHETHVTGEELDCAECHEGARRKAHAGFPGIGECEDCHNTSQGEHPDEPKVREYAKRGEQIPWVQVNRNEGHVYFSHRVHVTFADMECEQCHREVKDLEEPITTPNPALHSMDACMDCHRREEASLECVACHK